ncbi:helicase [Ruania suaedae]|uniref:C-terminal helicase domain-containing protein n=1 Tax=Ruania suaedae TaxID=2897774 RepID=UPI001E5FFE40|nr:helicase-related protein [Ruania suaedae]UFU01868.1 helicase [Ruania suaedae]
MTDRPDTAAALAPLKDFQRATVEHAHDRLWAPGASKRFLVADEVGLGKTMVARGVIARSIEELWETVERIDVVYVCSNQQIARQNLARLTPPGAHQIQVDRLTLLPRVTHRLHERLNVIALTPGTSLTHEGSGRRDERALMLVLLEVALGRSAVRARRWRRFFQGGCREENFQWVLNQTRDQDARSLDPDLADDFVHRLQQDGEGGPLWDELAECVADFDYKRSIPKELNTRRREILARMRRVLAESCVAELEPDLVILDEFQRFAHLLDDQSPEAELSRQLIDHVDEAGNAARTLLLSATPYKMYTVPGEAGEEDHYRDFARTLRFLGGDADPRLPTDVQVGLRQMRAGMLPGAGVAAVSAAKAAREQVQQRLRQVMCRTERLAADPQRNGMLAERMVEAPLTAQDVRAYAHLRQVVSMIDGTSGRRVRDPFEFWHSSPYPLHLMDTGSYVLKQALDAAVGNHEALVPALRSGPGVLLGAELERYARLDPGNAKMRALLAETEGMHELLWLPPSLPYYRPGGAFALAPSVTKLLVFSAWNVVPKAISAVLSYEAERRLRPERWEGRRQSYGARQPSPLLQYRLDAERDREAGMPALALSYPCLTLAELGDPLAIAREQPASDDGVPSSEDVLAVVRERVAAALADLPMGPSDGPVDEEWYWAAPFLLDALHLGGDAVAAVLRSTAATAEEDETPDAYRRHVRRAVAVRAEDLGRRPADLVEALARLAVAGPGVCALRALTRGASADNMLDVAVRTEAFGVAEALRARFNRPEAQGAVRTWHPEVAYWRAVLRYGVDGGIQTVLDEWAAVLRGAFGAGVATVAEQMRAALGLRTSVARVTTYDDAEDLEVQRTHGVRTHFAVRFGRQESEEQGQQDREDVVRRAFNSPFWPFVLASTSVGQEGLDFHPYCHAIVHWNLPGNPVDLEQREGRVHRYQGHAVRKNVAAAHGAGVLRDSAASDPWEAMFDAATAQRPADVGEVWPSWVYPGPAQIERIVPRQPLSREDAQYSRLRSEVAAYRLAFGQPRQEDLVRLVGGEATALEWARIDLAPPACS